MIVKHIVSSLWTLPFPDLSSRLEQAVRKGVERAPSETCTVFFRADDIGAPGRTFEKMIPLFQNHALPLNLAVVPTWLTAPRWAMLQRLCSTTPHLWNWHQHGWRHINHEPAGKKQEFGPARSREAKHKDLSRGQAGLQKILGEDFIPVFTPPWNRMDAESLESVKELGFKAISRSRHARPDTDLPDFQVNVDLHTRTEIDPHEGMDAFLAELEESVASGNCGIMIHHQRMNSQALEGLDRILATLAATPGIHVAGFRELTGK